MIYPFTQQEIDDKLRELGSVLIKKKYRDEWDINNPTFGYCYIVSEALYHYYYDNAISYCINVTDLVGEHDVHWFLKVDGEIIDYTGNQFDFDVPYAWARRATFFKGSVETERGWISKRGYEMAKYLGLIK